MTVLDEVALGPAPRVYAEGWQSWSPAGWYGRGDRPPRAASDAEQLMRFRPGVPVPDGAIQGEGLLVLDPGTGGPVHAYGATDGSVPTLRTTLDGDRAVVAAVGAPAVRRWTAADADGALAAYADAARAALADGVAAAAATPDPPARTPLRPAPTVWCSWYRYFEHVTAADVEENVRAVAAAELPVDVVQVDDGWSAGLGEYLAPRPSFGSFPRVVDAVRAAGYRAGVWVAPFVVGTGTTLARDHPEWLRGPAGTNWGTPLVGLDLTHPGVLDLLAELFAGLRRLGVDYYKLDFLYAGLLPGGDRAAHPGGDRAAHPGRDRTAHPGRDRGADAGAAVAAYRAALATIRAAVGEDAYLLGCGAPLLPSVGLVDAMRVSRDVFHESDPAARAGLPRTVAARAWQHGRLWVNDPDCLVARPSFGARAEWLGVVLRHGGLRSFSDRVAELDAWGLAAVRTALGAVPPPTPFGQAP